MSPPVSVVTDVEISPEEFAAVENVFSRYSIDAAVEPGVARRSVEELPFVVHVFMPIAAGFLGALGTDLSAGLKGFVQAMREARHCRQGSVVVEDRATATTLVLPTDIPDEAFGAFAELDWSELDGGYIVWDRQNERWLHAG